MMPNSPADRKGAAVSVPFQANFSPASVTASNEYGAPRFPDVQNLVRVKSSEPTTVENGLGRELSEKSTPARSPTSRFSIVIENA